jgi:predicted phage tail protein
MLASPKAIHALAEEFLKSRALIFVTGVIALVTGLAIVNTHNRWIADWPVIITLVGWAMVIGGVVRMVSPTAVVTIGNAMLDKPGVIRVGGVVWALIGAFLTYKGYA